MALSLLSFLLADSRGFQARAYDDAGEPGVMLRERLQIKPCPGLHFSADKHCSWDEELGTGWGNGLDYCINPGNILNADFHRVINNSDLPVCESGKMTFILTGTLLEGDMKFYLWCAFFFFFKHTNAFAYLPVVVRWGSCVFSPSLSCKFQKSKPWDLCPSLFLFTPHPASAPALHLLCLRHFA